MPDDPATKHPAYERPSRVLGAPIAPKISMPEPPPNSTRSLIPGTNIALPAEARIKVPISLGTLALVAFGSYSLANQRAIEREQIMDRVTKLEAKIETNTRALEESRHECEREARSMSVIESKIAAAQSELVVINSRLKD
jgi:hypothetical protein